MSEIYYKGNVVYDVLPGTKIQSMRVDKHCKTKANRMPRSFRKWQKINSKRKNDE